MVVDGKSERRKDISKNSYLETKQEMKKLILQKNTNLIKQNLKNKTITYNLIVSFLPFFLFNLFPSSSFSFNNNIKMQMLVFQNLIISFFS